MSAARLFATVVGAFMLIEGIWGLFSPVVFGVLSTNWLHASIHIVLGIAGLVLGRGSAARPYALIVGLILLVVGVLRFVPGLSDFVVSLLNVNFPVAYLNIVVGIAGILAWMMSRRDVAMRA